MSLIELATGLSLAIIIIGSMISFGVVELGKKNELYPLGMFFQDVITNYISLTQVSLSFVLYIMNHAVTVTITQSGLSRQFLLAIHSVIIWILIAAYQ